MDNKDLINLIERAVHTTGGIVAGIEADQWMLPTPCADWAVRDVVNHLVGGMSIFAAELTGRDPEAEHEADWLGADPAAAYAEAARLDLDAWRDPAAFEGTVTISLGTLAAGFAAVVHLVEVLVHGIDLAVATQQLELVDQGLSEEVLSSLVQMGGVEAFRAPGIFGPEVATTPQAAPHERLSGYLGRHPAVGAVAAESVR